MSSTSSSPTVNPGTSITAQFESYGDTYHFVIKDHKDLRNILELDEALWIATTAPSSTINTDEAFLDLLDSDKDGRIRAEEIKDGIRFLFANLTDYAGIQPGNTSLALSDINQHTELGQRIQASAGKVLKRHHVAIDTVSLEQVRQVQRDVLDGGLDQAGVVLTEAAGDQKTAGFIDDILATVGGTDHPSGKQGISRESLNVFLKESSEYLSWLREAGEIGADTVTTILPFGAQTADAYSLLSSVSDKLYQYFLLCDIKRINPELMESAVDNPETNAAVNLMQIDAAKSYLANAPLSLLNDAGILDFDSDINPYFKNKIEDLATRIVQPLLGDKVRLINKEDFSRLREVFEPYSEWLIQKPDVRVDSVDAVLLNDYVSELLYRQTLEQLFQQSYETAIVLDNIRELERLILYQANLIPLANSFVSFPHLYDPSKRALFEEGTLIMDGRHFTMAVKVEDRPHHIEMARNSHIFVIYCELYGKKGDKQHEIAVPVTSGNRGNLHLHKWGIFNDIDGNELHAKIVDIVENPISVAEAIAAPFVRLKQAFFSRVEEFSSKAEEQLLQKQDKKKETSTPSLLGIGGVAIAALGSSLAFITQTVAAMSVQTVFIALLVICAVLIVPSTISAYVSLSRRDLSMLLEGSGWGLNSRMKLSRAQADTFTRKPTHDLDKQK